MDDIRQKFRDHGLVRPTEGQVLGGVCAGLGRRFGIEPWPARLLFILFLFLLPGSPILIYPILWVLMPRETPQQSPAPYGTPPAQRL
jgi:phage shock protein C